MLLILALASINLLVQNSVGELQQQKFTLPSKFLIVIKMEAFSSQEVDQMVKKEYEMQLYGFNLESFTAESRLIELFCFIF